MSYRLPDAPYIREAESEGYPEYTGPRCPVCGEGCERVYMFRGVVVAGCDVCLQDVDAAEVDECFSDMCEAI